MSLPLFLYENRFKDATPVASTTAAGDYNVLNVRDWRVYTWWKPTAAPSNITVDCGSAKAADYALIYAEAGTYEIRGSTDNFSASNVLLATVTLTATGMGVAIFGSASYRYWRVLSTTGTPAVAIAAIGAKLEVPVGVPYGFAPRGRKVMGDFNRTNKGNPLGRTIEFEEWKKSIRFRNVSNSWIRNSFEPAWDVHLRSSPFAFAVDIGTYPNDVFIVNAGDGYDDPSVTALTSDLELDLSGVVP